MKRDERLRYLAKELYLVAQEQKSTEQKRSELKDKFFELLEDEVKFKTHLLPVFTIEVPDEFFDKTGFTKDDFASSRFPSWNIEHCERNTVDKVTVFVFKRDVRFIPDTIDLEDGKHTIRVQKEIAEYAPEIDWETLEKERPDLKERLAQPVTKYEVNEKELEDMMTNTPEDLAVLQRHFKVREPARKVVARRVKNGRETLR